MATTIPQKFNIVRYHHNYSIQDIIIYPHIKLWWYRTMLNFCGIVVAILKMATTRNCSNMWVDNDVPNWFLTLKNFYRSPFSKWSPQYRKNSTLSDIIRCFAILWWPFWKWRPVEIVQCQDSIRHIITYPHIKLWWYRTMLNFCGIVVTFLNNFYWSPFSKWPQQYRKNSTLSDIITIWYVGR
jgi:hypothetical protein